MKKWTGILIIALALILLSYFITGLLVKRTINKNINAYHDTSIMSVHLDQYQQGWFSSHASLTVKAHLPEQKTTDKNGTVSVSPPFDFDVRFPLQIQHGPFIFTDSGLRFGFGYVTTRPQTHYGALVDYFNNTLFRYNLPSLSMKGKSGDEDFQFDWLGLSSQLRISPNVDKLDGHLTALGLNGSANNFQLQSGEITDKFRFTYTQGLWLAQTLLSIPSVAISIGDKPKFNLEGFSLGLESNLKGGVLNYNCTLSLSKLLNQGRSYGPGSLILDIRNLDPKAMADIHRLEWTMLENNQNPDLNLMALLAELPKLLSRGSELDLSEMYLVMPEGKITGKLKISIPKNDIVDPAQLLTKVQGQGQFRAPITVVKQLMLAAIESDEGNASQPSASDVTPSTDSSIAPAPTDPQTQVTTLLQNYIDKGLLKIEGNDYVIDIKIENQQVFVNGKAFNPDMLNQ